MNTNSSRSRGKNASYHEIARDLITVDEVQALRDDDLILLPRGYRPIRCRVPHFFRHPELRAMAGLPPLGGLMSKLESTASRLGPWLVALQQRAGRLVNQLVKQA